VDEGGSVDGVSLSLKRFRGGSGEGSLVAGDPKGYVKKSLDAGIPPCGDPCRQETRNAGGSYTEDLDR
jgi:hypothetical protein